MVTTILRAIIALVILTPGSVAAGERRALPLEAKLQEHLPRDAQWALEAVDLEKGDVILSMGNAKDKQLVPASLVKLITTGAVLELSMKQGELDMTTTILYDGAMVNQELRGNLYLQGRGNALLSSKDLERAAETITAGGIKAVTGDIVADDTAFDVRGIERTRTGPAYSLPGALGMDLHTVALSVVPGKAGGPPTVRIEPHNDEVRIAVSAGTVAGMSEDIMIRQIDDYSYIVSGNIPEGSSIVKKRFSLQNPAFYAAGVIKTVLNKAGIRTAGRLGKGKTPEGALAVAKIPSPAVAGLIRDMNINSLNVVADNLLLLLGRPFGFPSTRAKGLKALEEHITDMGLGSEDHALADGSGLSGGNRLTAKFLAQYLHRASKRPWFRDFRESLPRAGLDGTAREIEFTDRSFRLKTGRIENAFCLAGYGTDRSGRRFAFSYLVNVASAGLGSVERSGAAVMKYLATEGMI